MKKYFEKRELEKIIEDYYKVVKGKKVFAESWKGAFISVSEGSEHICNIYGKGFYEIFDYYFGKEYKVTDIKTYIFDAGRDPWSGFGTDEITGVDVTYEKIEDYYKENNYLMDPEKEKVDESKIKNLVINIDMVNGFVKEGTLAAPSIMRVVDRQKEYLEEYKNAEDKGIIFIRDEHTKDAVEFKTFPEHCLKGSKESELIDELKEYYKGAYDFPKNSTNFVFAPGFQEQINKFTNLETVTLMGCLSEVCVKNGGVSLRNYFDQNNRDVEIYVAADAIDTYDAPGHNAEEVTEQALKDMEANGIKVLGRRI